MLRLVDGPVKGVFFCQRAPVYLRGVLDRSGQADVLDLLEDRPAEGETVYVYKREGERGWVHINRGRKGSGFYATGLYHYLGDVDGETLREQAQWHAWCVKQEKKAAP